MIPLNSLLSRHGANNLAGQKVRQTCLYDGSFHSVTFNCLPSGICLFGTQGVQIKFLP
jgi:hypothetical protein